MIDEGPPGLGFGQAALKLAPHFTLRTRGPGAQVAGAHVRLPIMFSPPGDRIASAVSRETPPPAAIEITGAAMIGDSKDTDGLNVTSTASPYIVGRVGDGYYPVTLDGRVLPKGFDLGSIDWSKIRQAEITHRSVPATTPDQTSMPSLNIDTWPK